MSDSLSAELAELKAVAAHNGGRFQCLDDLRWPRGAWIAVNVTVDFDAMLLRRLNNEAANGAGQGEFGGRVGIWRSAGAVRGPRHQGASNLHAGPYLRALSRGPGGRPRKVASELADHMWEHRAQPTEPALCARSFAQDRGGAAGDRAAAALSAHAAIIRPRSRARRASSTTPTARAAIGPTIAGCARAAAAARTAVPLRHRRCHVLQFCLASKRQRQPTALRHGSGSSTCQCRPPSSSSISRRAILTSASHPFVSGRALRIAMLDRLIAAMKALPGVWFASCEEVARHRLAAHPARVQPPEASTSPCRCRRCRGSRAIRFRREEP